MSGGLVVYWGASAFHRWDDVWLHYYPACTIPFNSDDVLGLSTVRQ